MNNERTKRVTVDLTGAEIELDGELYYLESGQMVLEMDYLYSADDGPDNPTTCQQHIEIEAKTYTPEAHDDD